MISKRIALVPFAIGAAICLTTSSPPRAQGVHGASIDGSSAAPAATPTTNAPAAKAGGILDADFEILASYTFNVPFAPATNQLDLAKLAGQIPESIKKLDGKVVRIQGFMLPVKESAGKATEFMIMRGQPSCCFSGATGVNEFITVKMAGKGAEPDMNDPVAVEGTLHVAVTTDNGYVMGIYSMDGERVIAPKH